MKPNRRLRGFNHPTVPLTALALLATALLALPPDPLAAQQGVEDGKICSCVDVDAHPLPNREDPLA